MKKHGRHTIALICFYSKTSGIWSVNIDLKNRFRYILTDQLQDKVV